MIRKENFACWLERMYAGKDDLFMVACKDRTFHDDERWVVASLTIEEMQDIHNAIGEYLKTVEKL